MALVSKGFVGRRRDDDGRTPPGQYLTKDFPVLAIGPSPSVATDTWTFQITTERGESRTWTWDEMAALPQEQPTVDIHCVTKWSKLDTTWTGVSLDVLVEGLETDAQYVVVHGFDGYTTNLPFEDLLGGKAWLVTEFDGAPLTREHGGPARLLVPHLYFWKSAKWVSRIELTEQNEQGFWERGGYHDYGDPWREQRYQGD
ncbi:sulfite oxidase-like oxidoreductase [Rhodococcoides corynebacterioides]|uniref:Sulfite oxidase-like oxidoreductase n=1 Tax=Rhodococcoides corynebacterioides TaxID=53972 RepID=A0ABS7P6D3_9NOCA|nr:sulfite oxidase-like oxidoreductase [Rhodococcus corynebacterioides]MBY6367983.1 sulfite oxidase-like oxidoreductase [Rhodococcus corynebacterioides]MBY6409537.1 sulfite oxidase-like oxidoreductase [Rhodococcus corynebacterioides]